MRYEKPAIESKGDVKGIMWWWWDKPDRPKPPTGGYR
jgi:hypothetical protein